MEPEHFLAAIKGYGGYSTTLVVIVFGFLTWWKVLPSLIDAIANRRSKIEERLGDEMEAMSARFMAQIAAADGRHEDCIKGQNDLRDRMSAMDLTIAEQNKTIAKLTSLSTDQARTITELNAQVAGMSAQARQATVSVLRSLPSEDMSPQMRDMKRKLDNL